MKNCVYRIKCNGRGNSRYTVSCAFLGSIDRESEFCAGGQTDFLGMCRVDWEQRVSRLW